MRRLLLGVAVVAAATYVVGFRLLEGAPEMLSFDIYGYFYPNILHALRSLADGGRGLLWNPYQNCGQPFFAITETGLLYPPNVAFLVLAPETALRAVLFINLVIGGLGAYALGREIGVRPAGAIGSAVAFMLGSAAYNLTTWMPTVQAPYMWLPAAMLCCERLLKRPSLLGALLLGIALAAALLPGHPQFVLFTCELIALRLCWAAFDRTGRRHLLRALGGVALGMVVMLLLTAAQFLPSLEVIGESVRRTSLHPEEIAPRGAETLKDIATLVGQHSALAPFSIVPVFVAVAAVVGATCRRSALFYLLAGTFFLILSLGDATPVGRLYYQLPLASLFRQPMRFRYVTGFCVAVLAGPAIDVLAEGSWLAVGVAAAGLAALYAWLGRLWPIDRELAAAVLAGALLAAALPKARPIGAAVIVGAIVLAPVLAPSWTTQQFLADDGPLRSHADLFERLRGRLTPHDRVHLALPLVRDPGFEEKTPLLFAMRSTTDYETQISQRYAEYTTMMQHGQLLQSLNQVYFPGGWDPGSVRWPLVDLAAARYLVIAKSVDGNVDPGGRLRLSLVDDDGLIRIYENPGALPRAYYVPRIAVVPDAKERLQRLASGSEDRRRLALVDGAPPSGFVGNAGNEATADARFLVDEPEHVVLETVAPERGFLFLADQYSPGWSATVNGQPAPILVGNHTFRLVEVPRGPVQVEFRYQPGRIWIGALISSATLLIVGAVLIVRVRRGHGAASAVGAGAGAGGHRIGTARNRQP